MRTLKAQLFLSYLLIVVLLVSALAATAYFLESLRAASDRLAKEQAKSRAPVSGMREAIIDMNSALAWFVQGGGEAARTRFERDVRQYRDARAQAETALKDPRDLANLRGSDALAQEFIRASNRLIYSTPAPGVRASQEYYLKTLNPSNGKCLRGLQLLRDAGQQEIGRVSRLARSGREQALAGAIGAAVAGLFLALLLSLGISRNVRNRLEAARSQAEPVHDDASDDRLQVAKMLSEVALNNIAGPVVVTGPDLRVVNVNSAAEALFGPAGQSIGSHVRELVANEKLASVVQRAADLSLPLSGGAGAGPDLKRSLPLSGGGQVGVRAFIPLHIADETRYFRVRSMPMHQPDGSLLGTVTLLDDVTSSGEIELAKGEFITVASHELVGPVSSLARALDALGETALGQQPDARRVLDVQKQDLVRLQNSLTDLLDASRFEAGAMHPKLEQTESAAPVRRAVDVVSRQAAAQGTGIEVDVEDDTPAILADGRQITRALVILLERAMAAVERGSTIRVRVRGGEDEVLFSVADQGPGIAGAALGRIFDRFVDVPGSSGLGLYIARCIVEAHGGTIRAANLPEGGTLFEFRIPAAGE